MESVPKKSRVHVEKLVYELMHYPKPIRHQILMEMDIIDIIMVAQADKSVSQWMREQNVWRDLWIAKVIPMMVALDYAQDKEHALEMSLGDNQRQNCLVWYFMCASLTPRFSVAYNKMKHMTLGTIRVSTYAGVAVNVEGNEETLLRLERRFFGSFRPRFGLLAWKVKDRRELDFQTARVFYALLSMGYHFIVTMRDDSQRTFYIRSKNENDARGAL
jgi:hypothetical protein